ncbi:MAG: sn-glycerol-1-phosphate dehydrogenase [Verrucomicrobiae bacterium]|nr:sn-glycerol-1-phosphate dehydrogenase [Verrucomicrobiae bacterium]
MNSSHHSRLQTALQNATDTRELALGSGVIFQTGELFKRFFPNQTAIPIADCRTFAAAGQRVMESLQRAHCPVLDPVIFEDNALHAEYRHVLRIRETLQAHAAIPIAIGSGTLNDLVKLASHESGRAYMVAATAASMDGYTAYGASITREGIKQTFSCPAPRVVVADIEILAAAPPELTAAGYGDLLAKIPAGADWLLANELGIEPIHTTAWSLVQHPLREWLRHPDRLRQGDSGAIARLAEGLIMTGFAMQAAQSSRPASGAEHQFSHLWDMQDHRFQGRTPLHGWKVGIGALVASIFYEQILAAPMEQLDIAQIADAWPAPDQLADQINRRHALPHLKQLALQESRAKYIDRAQLTRHLTQLKECWPRLQSRLREQLISFAQMRDMLHQAGAPTHPDEIGIDLPRLQRSCLEARQIRRRYTVLDLANETGLFPQCLKTLADFPSPFPPCLLQSKIINLEPLTP